MKHRDHQIEAVLFDLGGTLVRTEEIPKVLSRILENHGIHRSLEEITTAREEAEKGLDFRDLAVLLDEFWVKWNQRILANLQVTRAPYELAQFIATHWWDHCDVALYPDAREILLRLERRGLKLGVITNGLQSDVRKILPKVNLDDFFDVVVVIDTLRKMKPDAEVFHHALHKLGIAPKSAIFVGDEVEADYKGALGAGLTPYLIDRNNKMQDEDLNKISSLNDLLEVIQ